MTDFIIINVDRPNDILDRYHSNHMALEAVQDFQQWYIEHHEDKQFAPFRSIMLIPCEGGETFRMGVCNGFEARNLKRLIGL